MVNFNKHNDFPSIRYSVADMKGIIPFNKTLSSLDTVEDLITVPSNPSALNYIKNGLFNVKESGSAPTGWTNFNGVSSVVVGPEDITNGRTYSSVYGGGMCKITSIDNENGGIMQDLNGLPAGDYAVSIYIAAGASSALGFVALAVNDDNPSFSNLNRIKFYNNISRVSLDSVTITSNTNNWSNLTFNHRVSENINNVRIAVMYHGDSTFSSNNFDNTAGSNFIMYVDAVQFEPDFGVLDGTVSKEHFNSQNPVNTAIVNPFSDRHSRFLIEDSSDTEYNTSSIRERPFDEIRYVKITAEEGAVLIDFDKDVTQEGGLRGIYLREGETFEQRMRVSEKITFVNPKSCPAPIVSGYVLGV